MSLEQKPWNVICEMLVKKIKLSTYTRISMIHSQRIMKPIPIIDIILVCLNGYIVLYSYKHAL